MTEPIMISQMCDEVKKFEAGARTQLICGDVRGILLSEENKLQNNVYESIF